MGPATAQNFPCAANRLQISEIEESGGHGCISRELIPYPGRDILIQCHLLVNFISNAPYPWWPTMWSMDCQEHSESGKVRSHLGEGFLTNLISSPVGNAGCRDGFRASWHNCHRVVVEVVVPAFSAEIFSNSRCCWRFTSSS